MNDRPRPGGASLPPGETPGALSGARPPGQTERSVRADGLECGRLAAGIMLIGGAWHRPAPPASRSGRSGGPALAGVGADEPAALAAAGQAARSELAAAFGAGFTHQAERDRARRDGDGQAGQHGCRCGGQQDGSGSEGHGAGPVAGFAAGGVLDQMLPGTELAASLAAVRRAGYGQLSDTEVCGVISAWQRQESYCAEGKLDTIAELGARRAGPGGRPGEHADAEIGPLLTLTPQAAVALTGQARDLSRLPQIKALLAAGVIDPRRAGVITAQMAVLSDEDAAAVESVIAPRAGEQTTGELGSALAHAIKAHDPQAAARRRKRAEKDARVEVWTEPAGTAALAGRDLPQAGVIEATKSLDAAARWLKAHGVEGSFDKLRADAFLALVNHEPLTSLLPPAPGASTAGHGTDGAPGSTSPAPGDTSRPGDSAGPGDDAPAAGGTAGPGRTGPGTGDTGPRLGGTVHLTMPATTWAGLTDTPGDVPGIGPIDADTARDLTGTLAANPATRWCITLTDPHGRAIAHGCARAGPGPPGPGPPGPGRQAWLATVTITPIAATTCDHRHQSAGYQPSNTLRHLVKIRSPRCGHPGCRRPASRCDDDHTVPHHKGGRTCECNLYPLCRYHHRLKQAPGWHVAQPEPGVLVWTTPSGRTYTTNAEPYPA